MNAEEKNKILNIYTILTIISALYLAIKVIMYLMSGNEFTIINTVDFATKHIIGPVLLIAGYFILKKEFKSKP